MSLMFFSHLCKQTYMIPSGTICIVYEHGASFYLKSATTVVTDIKYDLLHHKYSFVGAMPVNAVFVYKIIKRPEA